MKDVKQGISDLTISTSHLETFTGEETVYHIDKIETERAFGKYVTELSKILRLLEFICDKTESYKFERRDEQVIFEKIDLIYDEHFSKEVEKIKANPYPDNLDIELRLRFIETYSRRVSKYHKGFIDRELVSIDKDGKVDKAVKAYDRFKLKMRLKAYGFSILKLIIILTFCYFYLWLIIGFLKFCISIFN
ncbi:MAG: hypothetical protein JWO58_1925 [Chitinophagaceae bacterium]|nr:hypothetical protein [Chitinophagaceae bacterium]